MIPDEFIPILYAVINVIHTFVAIPSELLADRTGKEKVLIIGYGAFLSTSLIFQWSSNYFLAFVIAMVFRAYDGITNTVARVLPKYADGSLRGTACGVYTLGVGSAFFVANTIVGMLWQYFGSTTAVTYSMTLSLIAIIGMLFINHHRV
ncbi:MAG: MFS transporter [Candidatus Bathyarchaeia archaeon]